MPEDESLDDYFAELYGHSDDPYQLQQRWYEQRKRAVVLASLARPRYGRVYEPGCGAAALTVALAARSEFLLASDLDMQAVRIARQRTAHLPQVHVAQHRLPQDWPHEQDPFDLIVLSEVGYFLSPTSWQTVAQASAQSLAPGGELLACDWRHEFAQRRQSTAEVQAALAAPGLHCLCRHEEADFVLQLWSRDARSVAQREGLVSTAPGITNGA